MNQAGRCPACGSLLPGRDSQRGGRKLRYCSAACKAKAYRDRQRSGTRADDMEPPLPPTAAARHARATEIRRQISELTATMADTASGQQALFASQGTTRRARPADTARTLHQLIAELATLATAATVTERVTFRRAPAEMPQTSPLFDEPGICRK